MLSLYRKYRPQKFEEVYGQEGMVEVLKEAIKQNKISHAYLFSGCRGIGKTTMARIFAKDIGCKSTDLIEIDAASHTSIEDIKMLAENIYTMPMHSPYTVYILDEVHMLSISAFNAFNTSTIPSCPYTSSNFCGLYFLYKDSTMFCSIQTLYTYAKFLFLAQNSTDMLFYIFDFF